MHNETSIASSLELILPWPPTVNTYWNFNGSRRFLTAKAKLFKAEVWIAFRASGHIGFGNRKVGVLIHLSPPDKRIRDIDNICKPLLDALTQAGVFEDDGQVDALMIYRRPVAKDGQCYVKVFDWK